MGRNNKVRKFASMKRVIKASDSRLTKSQSGKALKKGEFLNSFEKPLNLNSRKCEKEGQRRQNHRAPVAKSVDGHVLQI